MVMSHPSEDSSKRGPDVRNSSSSSSGVGDEKSREGRPQEDDTLSSILLMLKSNTNDDDDDVATDDLETLANVIGEDTDPTGAGLAGNDGCHAAFGNINSNYAENEIDESFASAVQTHMNRQCGAGESKVNGNGNGNGNGINTGISINSHGSIGSQKSSISRNIKIDDLRSYFHLPIVEVAKQLGICTTLLKRVCRTNKIKKWPYRQIRSIAKSIQSLEMASMNGLLPESERDKSQEQITFLKRSLEALIDDPSIPIDAAVEMAMRTVSEDGTLPDFIPNAELIGDSDPLLKPTAAQVIAASVASSSVDRVVLSSKPRPPKRKKSDMMAPVTGDGTGLGLEGGVPINGNGEYEVQLPLPSFAIGDSIVNQSIWSDGGKQRVTYLPPVLLTPLVRKKQHNPSKKLVPLIEPDICNCFQMDFLPLPLLRLSDTSSSSSSCSSSSQAVGSFIGSESTEGCNTGPHQYSNDSTDLGLQNPVEGVDVSSTCSSSTTSSFSLSVMPCTTSENGVIDSMNSYCLVDSGTGALDGQHRDDRILPSPTLSPGQ